MALQYAYPLLKQDRQIVIDAVTQNGLALQYAIGRSIIDLKVVLAAVTQNGLALQYTYPLFKSNKEVVLAAVAQDASALQYASETLKNDRGVVIDAVAQDASALQYSSEALKKDREFMLAAVTQDASALQYASEAFKTDHKFMLAAFLLKQINQIKTKAEEKHLEPKSRGAVDTLCTKLERQLNSYQQNVTTSINFVKECDASINEAKKELSMLSGWKQLLDDIVNFIINLFKRPIQGADYENRFSFFNKPDNPFENEFNEINSKISSAYFQQP